MENMFKTILRRAKEIKKTFLVNNVTMELKPVKTKQIINFTNVLAEVDTAKLAQAKGVDNFIGSLAGDLLNKFMNEVVFPDQNKDIDWGEIEFNLIYEIIDSFLALNPRLKTVSGILFKNFASLGEKILPLLQGSPVATD